MPNMQEIIKQIQRDFLCPICGKKYEIQNIKVRGAFDQTIIVQTICPDGHNTMFVTTFTGKKMMEKSITADEILDFSNSLNKFNGEFEKLWQR